jgi:hypothetical protein
VKHLHTFFVSWAISALFLFSPGCSNIPQEETTQELVPVSSIGIMPAQPGRITILPTDTQTRKQLEAGASIIDALLQDYFRDSGDVHFISRTELESMPSAESGDPLYLAREAGQQLHYDAVLITEVIRYQSRMGSAYAVNSPASVAISFKLLGVAGERVIWSADFDQTQQPLFDNILSTRTTGSGFRWLTAAELAKAGLTKKLSSCPYLK